MKRDARWLQSNALYPFLIGCAVLIVTGIANFSALNTLIDSIESVDNTRDIMDTIRRVNNSTRIAEGSQRGYLLTVEQPYLAPYETAIAELRRDLQKLQHSRTEIAGQAKRFQTLQTLVDRKIAEMDASISLAASGHWKDARQLVDTDVGRKLAEKINVLTEHMLTEESIQLLSRKAKALASRDKAVISAAILSLLSLILLVSLYVLMIRNGLQNLRWVATLEGANEKLEHKVKVRTNELSLYAAELSRSNRELQDFAYVASHDLQEPLRKIRAFGDRLQTKYSDMLPDTGKDYIQRMQNAAERMSRLINDLLVYSRVATRARNLDQIDLGRVLAEVLEDLEIRIEESGAEITVGTLPVIEADHSQMRQLFQNLVANSIKFVRAGEVPRIEIQSHPRDDIADPGERTWYRISVSDHGIGFEQKFAEKIFNPFQRLHQRTAYEGTGIGLAVCRRIIERHEGRIAADGSSGEGTTFTIDLPSRQIQETGNE